MIIYIYIYIYNRLSVAQHDCNLTFLSENDIKFKAKTIKIKINKIIIIIIINKKLIIINNNVIHNIYNMYQ